jgi:hypothetical protein
MPTVLGQAGFRFFFYSAEPGEPPHVHIDHAGRTAKYWLDPIELARSDGFRAHELGTMRELVIRQCDALQRSWNEHHGTPDDASPA